LRLRHRKVLVVFTNGEIDYSIDYKNPLKDWIRLLELGKTDAVSGSWRKIEDTGGMMPDYFFIMAIEKAYGRNECSDKAMSLARSIYNPMPADF